MIKSEKAKERIELLKRQLRMCELNDTKFGIDEEEKTRAFCVGKEIEEIVIQAESDAKYRSVMALNGINITDMDSPVFTHTKKFRLHFDYIKKEMIEQFKHAYDNE